MCCVQLSPNQTHCLRGSDVLRARPVQSSLGTDTTHLQRLSCSDASVLKDIASSGQADVGSVLIDDDDAEVLAVSFNYLRVQWQTIDARVRAELCLPASARNPRPSHGCSRV